MANRKIRNQPIYYRTAYFIQALKETSGLGPVALEKRIRENQYEKNNLRAPSPETVRDYFRLHLPVAFETPEKVKSIPWLMAAEEEFPGCAMAFFHPFFDLLYGPLVSSAYWDMKIRMTPSEWIESERQEGNSARANEWEQENINASKRRHRKLEATQCDPLTFIHTTLMRLTSKVRNTLFERRGISNGWCRKYSPIEDEISALVKYDNLDSLAALLGLVKESAEIGDFSRLTLARNAIRNHVPILQTKNEFKEIGEELSAYLLHELDNLDDRTYSIMDSLQLGLPAGWQPYLEKIHLEREMQKLLSRHIDRRNK